jgi:ABC-type uncharacterized transport system permease subunit
VTAAPALDRSPVGGDHGGVGERATTTWVFGLGLYVVAVVGALLVSSLLVVVAGGSPAEVFSAMWDGAFGSSTSLANTLEAAAVFGLVATGAVVANRAGLFNIGQEGQLSIGAGFAVWAAISFPGPGPVRLVAALVAGFVGGALWASVASVAKFRFSVNEVIATLLLNFVAFEALNYALSREYLLKPVFEAALPPQSGSVAESARLPSIESFTGIPAHAGVIGMVVAAVATWFVFARTPWGRRIDLLGRNRLMALRIGVRPWVTGAVALGIAGGAAGLAGAVMLTGVVYRVDPGFSNNVGWTGLLVALVARDRPLAVVPVAVAFGAIQAGGNLLAATGVPRSTVDVVQALVVLATVVPPVVLERRSRRRAASAVVDAERAATVPPSPATGSAS